MQNPLYVVSVDKAASEHAQNLASFVKELDISAECWTLDEYKGMASLSDSAFSEAKFIFIGKSAKTYVPDITQHYKKFGGRIGWAGGKCAISAKDTDLPFSEYKQFKEYCKSMQLEHPDVIVPPNNAMSEGVQWVKKAFSSDNNSALRAQYSALIHEFIDDYLIFFLSSQSPEGLEYIAENLEGLEGIANNPEGPEETKEVAQAQVNFKETLNTIKSAAKTTMTKPQQIACHSIIHGAALVTAACAFIPVPVADSIPITTAQISMVIGLGKVFNNEITKSDAKVLLATVAAPLAGRAAAKLGLMLIPGVGWALNGAIAATITEILGWTVAMDFAKKGRG